MSNETSDAYWDGFSAGYDDLIPQNPYNQETQKIYMRLGKMDIVMVVIIVNKMTIL